MWSFKSQSDLEKLILFSLVMFIFSYIVFFGQPSGKATLTVPCEFESNDILFGGRTIAVCHYEFIPSSGTESIYLQLPGTRDIYKAYISLTDVKDTTVYIDINGTLPPESYEHQSINIPSDANDIVIYGEIVGKGIDQDYPDYPYIKGGTYDLLCDVDCKYNKDVIIDSPGSYSLEIFSGYGGDGIDYKIFGMYKLPPPSVGILINKNNVFYKESITSEQTISISDYLTSKENIITLSIEGTPNFKVVVHTEQYCSLKGTDWNCMFVVEEGESTTTAICNKQIISTCDFHDVNIHIPIVDVPYYKDGKNFHATISGQEFDLSENASEIILNELDAGNYTLHLRYEIPYIVPEATKAAGVCALDKNLIKFVGEPGKEGATTFTLYNIGDSDILVRITVPPLLSNYITIQPSEQLVPAKSYATFTVYAKLPEIPTVLKSDIQIEGCAPEFVPLTIELNSSGGFDIYNYSIPILVAFLTFIGVLYFRRRIVYLLGPKIGYIVIGITPLITALLAYVIQTYIL